MTGVDDIKAQVIGNVGLGPQLPGAAAAAVHYLGVPDGYSVSHAPVGNNFNPNVNGSAPNAPTYVEGSETKIGAELSPEARAQLQMDMDKAGLYGTNGSYRLGLWDDDSQKALSSVLSYANQNGLDLSTALGELKANPLKKAVTPKAGTVTALTPAVTLEQSIQSSAEKRLGRRLRSSEVARFVSVYHGLEHGDNAAQSAAQDAAAPDASQSTTAPDGTVTPANGTSTELMPNTPGVAAGADGFIDSQYGQEAAGQSVAGYYDVIKNLIGGQ